MGNRSQTRQYSSAVMGSAAHISQTAGLYQSRFMESPHAHSRLQSLLIARLIAGHLAPQLDVRNPFFVTRDHDLGSFGDGAPIFAARAANSARADLRIEQFAG